jgi:hypothetical protein
VKEIAQFRLTRFPGFPRFPTGQYALELDNAEMGALRARIPAKSVLSGFGSRRGLLVAITDVQLRLKPLGGPNRDVRMSAGQTRWIDEAPASIDNLGAESCEFLFIVTRR